MILRRLLGQTDRQVILVVDEDRRARARARRALRRDGYVVHEAADPAEADALVLDLCPDLVLLTARLAGDSGPEILARWRLAGLRVPAVVMTGPCRPGALAGRVATALQGAEPEGLAVGA